MPNIPYIDYRELDEFYTIPKLCRLLNMSKLELKERRLWLRKIRCPQASQYAVSRKPEYGKNRPKGK